MNIVRKAFKGIESANITDIKRNTRYVFSGDGLHARHCGLDPQSHIVKEGLQLGGRNDVRELNTYTGIIRDGDIIVAEKAQEVYQTKK